MACQLIRPLNSNPPKPVPSEQKPTIQPDQSTQPKPVALIAPPKSSQPEPDGITFR